MVFKNVIIFLMQFMLKQLQLVFKACKILYYTIILY
jgi:hypothetical protein